MRITLFSAVMSREIGENSTECVFIHCHRRFYEGFTGFRRPRLHSGVKLIYSLIHAGCELIGLIQLQHMREPFTHGRIEREKRLGEVKPT